MNHISLFSGIGGFELASEWIGWNNIASCEINPFGNKILQYYWPNALHHDDVHTFTKQLLDEKIKDWNTKDVVLTGGFPCQPYSQAGKRKGKEDERHLWPEMLRVIQEIQPRWIVGENVRGLVNWNGGLVFDEVQTDLENNGYEVQPFLLPACGKNAPHRRDRIWFVAKNTNNDGRSNNIRQKESNFGKLRHFSSRNNVRVQAYNVQNRFTTNTNGSSNRRITRKNEGKSKEERIQKRNEVRKLTKPSKTFRNVANSDNKRLQRWKKKRNFGKSGEKRKKQFTRCLRTKWENFPTQYPICSGNDGIPGRLDGITFPKWRNESLKAYGNAVVPQIVYEIFKAIKKYEELK